MRKRNHIQILTDALTTTGLGLFLIVGFSGCDKPQDRTPDTRQKKEESNPTFFPPTWSGFFKPSSSVEHSGGG